MSRDRLADAYEEQAAVFARLADATAQIAHELRGIDPPLARSGVPASLPAAGAAGEPPTPAVPSFDELPPTGFEGNATSHPADDEPPLKPQVEAGLGKCPVHGKPWSVKAAGVSKAGAPYEAFYKCDSKDGDEFCKQKPQKIWRDLHPIPGAAAA